MASVKVYAMDGSERGSMDLNDAVFGVAANGALIHNVVKALMSNRRQGNASTKTRGQVRGGGAKPFRQKGSGRARRGTIRDPLLRGGGVIWGPHPRDYRRSIPARFKRQALCCVLSDRVRGEMLYVVESLSVPAPKTKPIAEIVRRLSPDGRQTLFVTSDVDRNVILSARNIPKVCVTTASDLNAVDVLGAHRVVMAADAVKKLEERLT